MLILGLDLGQSKSAWALFDSVSGEAKEGWVAMDEGSLNRLFARRRPEQLVLESGPLAGRVHDLAQACGIPVLVADVTGEAWPVTSQARATTR